MNRTYAIRFCTALIGLMFLGVSTPQAAPIHVTLSGLGFSAGRIAFDFIDGGAPNNSVSITESSLVGGSLDFSSGGIEGSLDSTLILRDSAFFTEFSTLYSGDVISFAFEASNFGPSGGSLPDSFSVLLLTTDLPLTSLISTSDPTGANVLLQFSIDGTPNGQLNVFRDTSSGHPPMQILIGVVPEPSTSLLLALGVLVGLSLSVRNARKWENLFRRV